LQPKQSEENLEESPPEDQDKENIVETDCSCPEGSSD